MDDWWQGGEVPDRVKWGLPEPTWKGDALTDLHGGRGTEWRRDARGGLYPVCACHGPKLPAAEVIIREAEAILTGPETSETCASPIDSDGDAPEPAIRPGDEWRTEPPRYVLPTNLAPERGIRSFLQLLRETLERSDR